jgi:hypothetical protein
MKEKGLRSVSIFEVFRYVRGERTEPPEDYLSCVRLRERSSKVLSIGPQLCIRWDPQTYSTPNQDWLLSPENGPCEVLSGVK